MPSTPRQSTGRHRSTLSLQKTEIIINVYDLLPAGRLSSTLWTFGASLLHTGVVINGREYAYGGHNKRGVSGVYWTKPRTEPPGGVFKCELLHGFTLATEDEINATLRAASEKFLGPEHSLLRNNCNHFTAYLCKALTGDPGPAWLNRASRIGITFPCLVPKAWIDPPDYDDVDGELLDDYDADSDEATEQSRMLQKARPNFLADQHSAVSGDNTSRSGSTKIKKASRGPNDNNS